MNITPWPTNTSSSMVTPSQMNVCEEILHSRPTDAFFWISTKAPIFVPSPTAQPYRFTRSRWWMTTSRPRRTSAATGTVALQRQLLEHQHAPLSAPIHARFEIGPGTAPFEDEHQAQHVFVQQGDVRRIEVVFGVEVEQVAGIGMKPRRHVDEPGRHPDHVRDRLLHFEHGEMLEDLAADHEVEGGGRL